MKKALISTNESPIYYVSAWEGNPPEPILTPIENSCRVAEVESKTFEVAEPLFWVDCPDNCLADQWYYNIESKQCFPVPELPDPI